MRRSCCGHKTIWNWKQIRTLEWCEFEQRSYSLQYIQRSTNYFAFNLSIYGKRKKLSVQVNGARGQTTYFFKNHILIRKFGSLNARIVRIYFITPLRCWNGQCLFGMPRAALLKKVEFIFSEYSRVCRNLVQFCTRVYFLFLMLSESLLFGYIIYHNLLC